MTMPYFVDIIFLDIDGVLLPFGGTAAEKSSDMSCYTNGCIFPDCTMDALTSLLQRTNNIQICDKQSQPQHSFTTRLHDVTPSTVSCKIILSSTWRARPDFIQDILDSFLRYATEKSKTDPTVMQIWKPHLDSFFDITDPNFHSSRHDEIFNWMNQHDVQKQHDKTQDFIVRSWIALDDEDLVNIEGCSSSEKAKEHAVLIESSVGLTLDNVSVGIRLLEKQYQKFYNESLSVTMPWRHT